jgi:hypothetical protein
MGCSPCCRYRGADSPCIAGCLPLSQPTRLFKSFVRSWETPTAVTGNLTPAFGMRYEHTAFVDTPYDDFRCTRSDTHGPES